MTKTTMNDVAKHFKAPVPVLFLLTLCLITALLSTTKSAARKLFFFPTAKFRFKDFRQRYILRFSPPSSFPPSCTIRSHLHTLSKYLNFNLLTYQGCENRNIKILCYCKCVNIYYFHLTYLKYIFEFSMCLLCLYVYRH